MNISEYQLLRLIQGPIGSLAMLISGLLSIIFFFLFLSQLFRRKK